MSESKCDNALDQFDTEIRESLRRFKRDILGVYAFCCVTQIIVVYFLLRSIL
jgi:hypothetical protein